MSGGAFDFQFTGVCIAVQGLDIAFGGAGGDLLITSDLNRLVLVSVTGETLNTIAGSENLIENCSLGISADITLAGDENIVRRNRIHNSIVMSGNDNHVHDNDINGAVTVTGDRSIVEMCDIDGVLDCDGANRCSFRNLTVGVGARGIHIHNACEFLNFQNIRVLLESVDDSNPSIEIYSGTDCSFSNIEVEAGAAGPTQVSLYIRASERISFKDSVIAAYDTYALHLERDSSLVEFDNVKFSGRGQVIETYDGGAGVANNTNAAFRNCHVYNTGVAHNSHLASFIARDDYTGQNPIGIVLDNCLFEDQNCSFSNGIAGPMALLYLIGVSARDIQIDCSTSVMNQDGPVLYMKQSCARSVHIETGVGAGLALGVACSEGIVEVIESELYDLVLQTHGSWKKPALYVRGGVPVVDRPIKTAIVDGATFPRQNDWWNISTGAGVDGSKALLAQVLDNAVVRHVKWTDDNDTHTPEVTDCLFTLEGDSAAMEECFIYHVDGQLDYVIRVGNTGVPADNIRIANNYIRLTDPRAGGVALKNCILCADPTGADISEHGTIEGNFIRWEGDGNGPGPLLTEAPIYVGLNNYFWKVINNHIEVKDITAAAAGLTMIYFESPLFPAGGAAAGGQAGGSAICMGNTIRNLNTLGGNLLPAITATGGVVIGAALNVLCND